MSAAPRTAWATAGVSPSAAPTNEPKCLPPPSSAGTPRTPRHDDVIWFLGDILKTFGHWAKRGTLPCRPDDFGECTHCRIGDEPHPIGFAPVLFRIDDKHGVWQPRTMRVPQHHIDAFGTNLRGRQYRVVASNAGRGNRSEFSFFAIKRKTPPIEAFDAAQIMENIWSPRRATKVVVPEHVLVTDDIALSPKEKTVREEILELDDVKLADYFKRYEKVLPGMASIARDELDRRGISIDHPNAEKPAPKDRKHSIHLVAVPVDADVEPPVAADRKRGAA